MKTKSKKILLAIVLLIVTMTSTLAQSDSTQRRNLIKLDVTSYWLYRNSIVFSYERVPKYNSHHSWIITAGYQQFPGIGSLSDTVQASTDYLARGFKAGGEYRFYLKSENKFNAPHGVYIGPYLSYHNYHNGRSFEIDNNGTAEQLDLSTRLNVLNIGVQLGYQFVINNRWAIDFVLLGPSVSRYSFKATLDGNFTIDPDDITNEVVLKLINRFPGLNDLINEGEVDSGGKVSTWAYGWRYQLHVGYHFGRNKK